MIIDIEDKIVSAAVLFKVAGTEETVVLPSPRHFDLLTHETLNRLRPYVQLTQISQGFITVKGTYLTRKEAWVIAGYHGQIAETLPCNEGYPQRYTAEDMVDYQTLVEVAPALYSENLY